MVISDQDGQSVRSGIVSAEGVQWLEGSFIYAEMILRKVEGKHFQLWLILFIKVNLEPVGHFHQTYSCICCHPSQSSFLAFRQTI